MQYKQEHKEFIENIIKKSPGFKGNEGLLEEMADETFKKSSSLIENQQDITKLEIYIKKIARSVVMDTIKYGKPQYDTDADGKLIYDVNVPDYNKADEVDFIEDEKINAVKDKLIELDIKNPQKNFKQIFELRFVREMNCREIAEKLIMDEKDVSAVLLEIFRETMLILAE